jgi:hypothetical protein
VGFDNEAMNSGHDDIRPLPETSNGDAAPGIDSRLVERALDGPPLRARLTIPLMTLIAVLLWVGLIRCLFRLLH